MCCPTEGPRRLFSPVSWPSPSSLSVLHLHLTSLTYPIMSLPFCGALYSRCFGFSYHLYPSVLDFSVFWLRWRDNVFSWSFERYIHLATSLFRFIHSLRYFHKMSGSHYFDQFMSRQQRYWIGDLCTTPPPSVLSLSLIISCCHC